MWRRQPATRLRPRHEPEIASIDAEWTSRPVLCVWLERTAGRAVLGLGDRVLSMPAEAHGFLAEVLGAPGPWTTDDLGGDLDAASKSRRSLGASPPKGWSHLVEFQCAAAARARDEPITATASQVRAWLLIEVLGAWGKDAIGQSELGPFAPHIWRDLMRRQGIRIIAIRRDVGHRSEHHETLRLVHVAAPRPGGRPGRAIAA